MKRFKETSKEIYEMSKQEKLAHDTALISEAGEDICAVPIGMLKSKVLRDRHKNYVRVKNIGALQKRENLIQKVYGLRPHNERQSQKVTNYIMNIVLKNLTYKI